MSSAKIDTLSITVLSSSLLKSRKQSFNHKSNLKGMETCSDFFLPGQGF